MRRLASEPRARVVLSQTATVLKASAVCGLWCRCLCGGRPVAVVSWLRVWLPGCLGGLSAGATLSAQLSAQGTVASEALVRVVLSASRSRVAGRCVRRGVLPTHPRTLNPSQCDALG